MKTLQEIESAVDSLPPDEREELFLYLALRLRSEGGNMPEPRDLGRDRIEGWIREDEEAYRRFQERE